MSMNIIDLLTQRGLVPVKISDTHGGEYASPCPKCGGSDRFRCWPEMPSVFGGGTWFCRNCARAGGCVDFLMHVNGYDFPAACKTFTSGKKND